MERERAAGREDAGELGQGTRRVEVAQRALARDHRVDGAIAQRQPMTIGADHGEAAGARVGEHAGGDIDAEAQRRADLGEQAAGADADLQHACGTVDRVEERAIDPPGARAGGASSSWRAS
jgi:hypothetical protein